MNNSIDNDDSGFRILNQSWLEAYRGVRRNLLNYPSYGTDRQCQLGKCDILIHLILILYSLMLDVAQ